MTGREGTSGQGGENPILRVLIVDDHALFRRGLFMVLKHEADIQVVGEASDGSDAVRKAQ